MRIHVCIDFKIYEFYSLHILSCLHKNTSILPKITGVTRFLIFHFFGVAIIVFTRPGTKERDLTCKIS